MTARVVLWQIKTGERRPKGHLVSKKKTVPLKTKIFIVFWIDWKLPVRSFRVLREICVLIKNCFPISCPCHSPFLNPYIAINQHFECPVIEGQKWASFVSGSVAWDARWTCKTCTSNLKCSFSQRNHKNKSIYSSKTGNSVLRSCRGWKSRLSMNAWKKWTPFHDIKGDPSQGVSVRPAWPKSNKHHEHLPTNSSLLWSWAPQEQRAYANSTLHCTLGSWPNIRG